MPDKTCTDIIQSKDVRLDVDIPIVCVELFMR